MEDLKNKNKKELNAFINSERVKLSELKFNLSLKKVKNTSEIRKIKKDIARALTILCQKED